MMNSARSKVMKFCHLIKLAKEKFFQPINQFLDFLTKSIIVWEFLISWQSKVHLIIKNSTSAFCIWIWCQTYIPGPIKKTMLIRCHEMFHKSIHKFNMKDKSSLSLCKRYHLFIYHFLCSRWSFLWKPTCNNNHWHC